MRETSYNTISYVILIMFNYMTGGVTRLGGFPTLPGRLTRSAGVTICHVNVSRWGNPPSRVTFMAKSSKAKHVCFKTLYIS